MSQHSNLRIAHSPLFQRGTSVSFRFNGATIQAYEGETVGVALHAAGVKIFSRSVKYHRPRGLFCLSGNCPNCLMQVDGMPNVRTCQTPVRAGMEVRTQTGWPSTRFDVLAFMDSLSFLFPLGFQYRYCIRPRWLYHLWERLLRHLAGHGVLSSPSLVWQTATKTAAATDIAVIGGGPAGLSAALAAVQSGAQVTLIDEGTTVGGSLRADTSRYQTPQRYAGMYGWEIAQQLSQQVHECSLVQVYAPATAFGFYGDNTLGVRADNSIVKLTAKRIIVATGAYENPLVVDNWDRPGVFLATGVQKMLHLWGMRPGKVAVVVSTNDFGLQVAAQLLEAGVEIRAIADSRIKLHESQAAVEMLRQGGVPLLTRHTLSTVVGHAQVHGASLARVDDQHHPIRGTEVYFPCDTVVLATGLFPANELVFHAAYKGSYVLESSGSLVRIPYRQEDMKVEEGLYVAGNAAGIGDFEKTILEGENAGLSAALSLGLGGAEAAARQMQAQRSLAARREE